ncbi:hypothetical protein D3C84_776280 [compost metagenome]
MHAADQRKTLVIDGVAAEHLPEEIMAGAQCVVGLIDRRIARRRLPFKPGRHSRQEHFPLSVMNAAPDLTGLRGRWQEGRRRRTHRWQRRMPKGAHMAQGTQGAGALPLGAMGNNAVEDVRRNETAQ